MALPAHPPPNELVPVPRGCRRWPVTRAHFITMRHYYAWLAGRALRRPGAWARKHLGLAQRERLMRGRPYRCAWPGCDATAMLTVDHIVPVAVGGSSNACNLRYLCQTHQQTAFAPWRAAMRAGGN